jgi:hypothetical protein
LEDDKVDLGNNKLLVLERWILKLCLKKEEEKKGSGDKKEDVPPIGVIKVGMCYEG